MLWGNWNQAFRKFIDESRHLVLVAPHPYAEVNSPGCGFLGCDHFKQANDFFKENGYDPWTQVQINWGIF
jgi:uracil-DNA glycosylase